MKILIYKEDLSSFELNGLVALLVITMACFSSFFAGMHCGTETNVTNVEVVDTFYTHLDTLQFNETNLMKVIKHYDIWYPQIAFNQSKLETANWTSDIFKENNNLFGFRVFGSWKGKELPFKNRGHLCFTHWTKSVEHYKMWQQKNYNKQTYLQFLSRVGYAEDKTYIEKIK